MSRLGGVLVPIERAVHAISRWSCWVSGGVLVALTITVGVDVAGRELGDPLRGSINIGEMLLVLIAFTAMAFTQLEKGHVRVELLISHLSPRLRAFLDTITFLLSAFIFALVTYVMLDRAVGVVTSDAPVQVTAQLAIPIWPFFIVIAIGALLLCLELMVDFGHAVARLSGKESS